MRIIRTGPELGLAIKDAPFNESSFFISLQALYAIYSTCCKCVRKKKRDELDAYYYTIVSITEGERLEVKTILGGGSVQFQNGETVLLTIL